MTAFARAAHLSQGLHRRSATRRRGLRAWRAHSWQSTKLPHTAGDPFSRPMRSGERETLKSEKRELAPVEDKPPAARDTVGAATRIYRG